mmetsp:Transcript_55987/g.128476  ORF Transcript_55987/g.128476 Transcript_55987/m.128476 type:complete len:755 (+) Transcript_55987:328-2592(+)
MGGDSPHDARAGEGGSHAAGDSSEPPPIPPPPPLPAPTTDMLGSAPVTSVIGEAPDKSGRGARGRKDRDKGKGKGGRGDREKGDHDKDGEEGSRRQRNKGNDSGKGERKEDSRKEKDGDKKEGRKGDRKKEKHDGRGRDKYDKPEKEEGSRRSGKGEGKGDGKGGRGPRPDHNMPPRNGAVDIWAQSQRQREEKGRKGVAKGLPGATAQRPPPGAERVDTKEAASKLLNMLKAPANKETVGENPIGAGATYSRFQFLQVGRCSATKACLPGLSSFHTAERLPDEAAEAARREKERAREERRRKQEEREQRYKLWLEANEGRRDVGQPPTPGTVGVADRSHLDRLDDLEWEDEISGDAEVDKDLWDMPGRAAASPWDDAAAGSTGVDFSALTLGDIREAESAVKQGMSLDEYKRRHESGNLPPMQGKDQSGFFNELSASATPEPRGFSQWFSPVSDTKPPEINPWNVGPHAPPPTQAPQAPPPPPATRVSIDALIDNDPQPEPRKIKKRGESNKAGIEILQLLGAKPSTVADDEDRQARAEPARPQEHTPVRMPSTESDMGKQSLQDMLGGMMGPRSPQQAQMVAALQQLALQQASNRSQQALLAQHFQQAYANAAQQGAAAARGGAPAGPQSPGAQGPARSPFPAHGGGNTWAAGSGIWGQQHGLQQLYGARQQQQQQQQQQQAAGLGAGLGYGDWAQYAQTAQVAQMLRSGPQSPVNPWAQAAEARSPVPDVTRDSPGDFGSPEAEPSGCSQS